MMMAEDNLEELITRLGGRLRELRLLKDLSQDALAILSGVGQMTISRIEAGANEPAWGAVVRLAYALGTTPDDFLKRPAAKAPPPLPLGPKGGKARQKKKQ